MIGTSILHIVFGLLFVLGAYYTSTDFFSFAIFLIMFSFILMALAAGFQKWECAKPPSNEKEKRACEKKKKAFQGQIGVALLGWLFVLLFAFMNTETRLYDFSKYGIILIYFLWVVFLSVYFFAMK